ncbi:MAG: Beta-hexosaminidase [Candidatus Marinimicrobia bacterium]|nr:Beta-hexosaminidase [Candidatus Neomarinimicrobiota bacterium]
MQHSWYSRLFVILLGFTLVLATCGPKPSTKPEKQPSLTVDEQMAAMSLEEKVGQMFMPNFGATFYSDDSWSYKRVSRWITEYHIGGLSMFGGDPYEAARNIYRFQKMSKYPLLIGSDFEWGIPMRISAGTRFPENMGIGATGKPEFAYQQGVITAKESKALGVHMNFAPALDVNNNPDNPIINVRSYSEDPEMVAKFGVEYIKGLQSEHVAATAKHFPGHGDTDVDSHLSLPEINVDRERLNQVELLPFQAAIDAGVKSIMVAHLALPKITGNELPATLSPYFLKNVLRDSLGYGGLLVTDAMNMGGVQEGFWPGEAAVKSIQAGMDVILYPPDLELAYETVLNAVKEGHISEKRINESVRRILEFKKFVKVEEHRYPDLEHVEKVLEDSDNLATAAKAFQESITLVKDENNAVPFKPADIDSMVTLIITDDIRFGFPGGSFAASIGSRVDHYGVHQIGPQASDSVMIKANQAVEGADAVAVGVFVRFGSFKGTINLPEDQAEFLSEVLDQEKPIITVGFGTPYLLRYFPEARSFFLTYSSSSESQRTVAAAMFGEQSVSGTLPISLPAGYEMGHGLKREPYSNVWTDDLQDDRFQEVFDLIEQGIADSVAPGMAMYAARDGKVLAAKGFGHFTYDESSPKVTRETIFDMASITKVTATTPLAMKMYESRYLNLNKQVKDYIPEFSGGLKDSVKIINLLTHTAGLQPFIKFWEVAESPDEVMDIIVNSELIYTPGDSTVYSDLGIIMLGKILEKLGQNSLDKLVEKRIYRPLGMTHIQYLPDEALRGQIAPTEFDKAYRHKQIQGEVHDENAAFLGGVAGHAGLFSTVDDLGRYAQMYLSNGYYDGRKHFKSTTIDTFTARQNIVEGSTRALGWDTPSDHGSLYGDYVSSEAFGHTGFTGTSILIDPKYDAIVILLTNRVYPTRQNHKIGDFRPKFHNAAMKVLLSEEELEQIENR